MSKPIMQSFWYNNRGKTLDQYKYNQICFLLENNRFLLRNDQWYQAPFQTNYDEPEYIALPPDANPIHDLVSHLKTKDDYLKTVENFRKFSSGISFESQAHWIWKIQTVSLSQNYTQWASNLHLQNP